MFFTRLEKKTDEELMMLLQQGNGAAMTQLYQRYATLLVRYFHRMLWKDRQNAQDFLQDLFVKLIENPNAYDRQRRFPTWLYAVAHNMCKNEYRKQAVRAMAKPGITESLYAENSYQQKLEHIEFQLALEEVLNGMDEDDKHLFVLKHELDLSIAEIANILSCPAGTIKSRLFYMKKKLAVQLHTHHPSPVKL